MSEREETRHTPTPWKQHADVVYSPGGKATICAVSNPRGSKYIEHVEVNPYDEGWAEAMANAAFIVKAANCHDDLHEALTLLLSALERTAANFRHAVRGRPVRDMAETLAEGRRAEEKARAALAKAEGKG